jgi:hypothetical protein
MAILDEKGGLYRKKWYTFPSVRTKLVYIQGLPVVIPASGAYFGPMKIAPQYIDRIAQNNCAQGNLFIKNPAKRIGN